MFLAGSPPPNHSLQHLRPPDATTRPQDVTTRRGGWVGTKTRTRGNDEGGDGLSCPSSQNVRFVIIITLYIHANTHPLPPAIPPLQPNTKNAPQGVFFVFGWFSSTHPIHPLARHGNVSHMGHVFMSGWIYLVFKGLVWSGF